MPIQLMTLDDIPAYDPPEWYWHGFIAPATKTVLAGQPKAGKTTLLSHVLRGLSGNSAARVGPPVRPARTLLISEEHPRHWARRRDALGLIGSEIYFMAIMHRYYAQDAWLSFIKECLEAMLAHDIKVIIFDTISSIWPVVDENDSMQVAAGLDPLNYFTEAGLAVLVIHHIGKSPKDILMSARGSSYFNQFFDIIVAFTRHGGKGPGNAHRALTALSREEETPDKMVLSFQPDSTGYTTLSVNGHDELDEQMGLILKTLPTEPPGITSDALHKSRLGFSHDTLNELLDAGTASGRWTREGKGVRGSPRSYWSTNSQPILTTEGDQR